MACDLNAIERHLNRAGVRPSGVVAIHAGAAFESTRLAPDFDQLRVASRIDFLTDLLRGELLLRSAQRRALRLIDEIRTPADKYQAELQFASKQLSSTIAQWRGTVRDLDTRWQREVDRHYEVLQSQVRLAIERRRSWHLDHLENPRNVESAWHAETNRLTDELTELVERAREQLAQALQGFEREVVSEWQAFGGAEFQIANLDGFRMVWANRAIRLGIGVAAAVAGMAAAVGGA